MIVSSLQRRRKRHAQVIRHEYYTIVILVKEILHYSSIQSKGNFCNCMIRNELKDELLGTFPAFGLGLGEIAIGRETVEPDIPRWWSLAHFLNHLGYLSAGKRIIQPMTNEAHFWIVCPCGCLRTLRVENSPFAKGIPHFGNKIWQHLVNEKGLEGAIQYLHNSVDRARRDQSA